MKAQDEFALFCNNIKRLRHKEGLSRKEMAARIGIGVSSLTRLEQGELPPRLSASVICRISREFGVHPKELFTSVEEQNKQPK